MVERKLRSDFKFNIGDIIKDNSRNLQIISRKRDKTKNSTLHKYYRYKCLNCGWDCGEHYNHRLNCYNHEFWVLESNLSKINGSGCACCNNKVVIKNVNNLLFKYSEVAKYLVNTEDGYTHTSKSPKKILCKCPVCNNTRYYSVQNLVVKGFYCDKCSDGISFSEKFISNLLSQLNIKYVRQFCLKSNVRKYFYDFYFEYHNKKYIIEANGIQHYKETKFSNNNTKTLDDEIRNDKEKFDLALRNGINYQNYIVIDARVSELEYIKNSIIHSNLSSIFDIKNIDWNECLLYASKSILPEICQYWEQNHQNISLSNLSKKYNLDRSTITQYLKNGTKIGICNYDPQIEKEKQYNKLKMLNRHGKPVEIFKDGISYGRFINCSELARQSEKLFGVKMKHDKISAVCLGIQKTHKGFTFNYI